MTEQAQSKIIPNSYQSPNYLVDDLMHLLSGNEQKCVDLVCRKTFGWQKRSDRISKSQLVLFTGIHPNTIDKCMAELVRYHIVIRVSESVANLGVEWSIQTDDKLIDLQGLQSRAAKRRERNQLKTRKATYARQNVWSSNDHTKGRSSNDHPGRSSNDHYKSHYQKPESSSTSTESEHVVLFYKQNIGDVTPAIHEKLNAAQKIYSADWILDALGEAVHYNKKSWAYAEAILKRWKQEGKTKTKGAKNGKSKNWRGDSKRPEQQPPQENFTDADREAAERIKARRKQHRNV